MNQGKKKSIDDRSKTKSDISRNQVHQVINALYYSYSNLETNQRTIKHSTFSESVPREFKHAKATNKSRKNQDELHLIAGHRYRISTFVKIRRRPTWRFNITWTWSHVTIQDQNSPRPFKLNISRNFCRIDSSTLLQVNSTSFLLTLRENYLFFPGQEWEPYFFLFRSTKCHKRKKISN